MSKLLRIKLVCPYCGFKFKGFYIVRRIWDLIKGEQYHMARCGWSDEKGRHGCNEPFMFRRYWRNDPEPDWEYFCLGKADRMKM